MIDTPEYEDENGDKGNTLPPRIPINNAIIRIEIDNEWDIIDFETFFVSISYLFECSNLEFVVGLFASDKYKTRQIREYLRRTRGFGAMVASRPSMQLFSKILHSETRVERVKAIKYSSPGYVEIIANAAVIAAIIHSITSLIKYYVPNKKATLENELLEQKVIAKFIKNLGKLKLSKDEIKELVTHYQYKLKHALKQIETLQNNKKIKKIDLKKNDK